MSETKTVDPKAGALDAMVLPTARYNAAVRPGVGVLFASVGEMWSVAEGLRKGGAGPEGATTAQIFASIAKGQAIGIDPVQSMSSITVVRGRASLMGDLALGLIRASKLLGSYRREWVGTEGQDDYGCKISMKRSDTNEEIDYTFTWREAKRAGIVKTKGDTIKAVWAGFMKRMLYYRALGFACRDLFSDVLMGLYLTEELQSSDYFEPRAVDAVVTTTAAQEPDPLLISAPPPATLADSRARASEIIAGLEPLAASSAPEPAPEQAKEGPQDAPGRAEVFGMTQEPDPEPEKAPAPAQAPSGLSKEQAGAIARLDAKSASAVPAAKRPRQSGLKL